MTIYIFYRHLPTARSKDKNRPKWFSYESCFSNLLQTVGKSKAVRVVIQVMFDGTDEDLRNDFMGRYARPEAGDKHNCEVEVHRITGGSNTGAWHQTLRLASNPRYHHDDDLIYFLENDYLHVHNWVDAIADIASGKIAWHYLSLYDHNDKYQHHACSATAYRNLKSQIYVTRTSHWRTTPSTCGSFIVRPYVFLKDQTILGSRFPDRYLFPILRILKRRILLTPIPGLSTHCMSGLLSPCIDWESLLSASRRPPDSEESGRLGTSAAESRPM